VPPPGFSKMDALDKTSLGKRTNGHFYSGTIHSGNHFFLKIIDFYVFHTLLLTHHADQRLMIVILLKVTPYTKSVNEIQQYWIAEILAKPLIYLQSTSTIYTISSREFEKFEQKQYWYDIV